MLRASLPARRPRCSSARTASLISTSQSASAARRAWPPALTTRSSSTRKTTRPRSATSARTGLTWGLSRRAWSSARPRPSSSATCATPTRKWHRLLTASPSTCAGPRRRLCRSSFTRARTRPRSTRSRPDGPTAVSSCGASSTRALRLSSQATRSRTTPAPRRSSLTTWRTRFPGTGA